MKKFFILMLAVVAFTACKEKCEDCAILPVENITTTVLRTYKGTVTVTNGNGNSDYVQQDVSVEFAYADGAYSIKMYNISFSEKMPISLTAMIIPNVTVTKAADGEQLKEYYIEGNGIVPIASMGGQQMEYERYTITDLDGSVASVVSEKEMTDTGTLSFTMTCGTFPTQFEGTDIRKY